MAAAARRRGRRETNCGSGEELLQFLLVQNSGTDRAVLGAASNAALHPARQGGEHYVEPIVKIQRTATKMRGSSSTVGVMFAALIFGASLVGAVAGSSAQSTGSTSAAAERGAGSVAAAAIDRDFAAAAAGGAVVGTRRSLLQQDNGGGAPFTFPGWESGGETTVGGGGGEDDQQKKIPGGSPGQV